MKIELELVWVCVKTVVVLLIFYMMNMKLQTSLSLYMSKHDRIVDISISLPCWYVCMPSYINASNRSRDGISIAK